MRKLKLDVDALSVDSFTTERKASVSGTVRGHVATDFNECGISNPCTTDQYATIDASLCGGGSAPTANATTCGVTNICCGFSRDRTFACCQFTSAC